jgi:hypothetical protein
VPIASSSPRCRGNSALPALSAACRILLLAVLAALTPAGLHAQLFERETKNLRLVYYSKAHEYLTPHIVNCFENAFDFERRLFDYHPKEKVNVLLQDFGDYASGAANTVPFNFISIGIAPFSYVYETMPAEERFSLMMEHELVHVITMDKPSPRDTFFRSLFCGKVAPIAEQPLSMAYGYLTGPRWYAPRWYIESIAVFMETWMAGGLGRAQGAYDEMVFRTMVHDSSYIFDVVGLEAEGTKVDFQVGAASYLYGTRFISYLALTHGPERLLRWFIQSPGSSASFSSQFEEVYHTSLDDEWHRWIEWERRWQRANLDSLRRYPLTRYRAVTREAMGSVSRSFFDLRTRRAYVAVNFPGQTPHITAVDLATGAVENLQEVRGGALFYVTSLAYDPASRTLFYTTDNNHWRDLYSYSVTTGDSRLLIKDARTGDFAFNRADRSLWGVRHFNGISTLVRIPYPYTEWNQVFTFDYGNDIFDIDISPDGSQLVGALTHVDGTQYLIRMKTAALLTGDASYDTLYDFGNSTPANFVFSEDGTKLYGSSFYSGVSNIVRYDIARRSMDWVTNGETGFFRPLPLPGDSLLAFHFKGSGFEPVVIADGTVTDVSPVRYLGRAVVDSFAVLETWALPPPSKINTDSVTISIGDYSPMGNIRLASLYPIVEGYKVYPGYGLRFNFSDPIMLHRIDLSASYTPNRSLPQDQRIHASFNYNFWEWGLSGAWNPADFYDIFGPTRVSRKGSTLGLSYRNYWTFEEPETMEFAGGLTGYWGLERLPEYQNIAATFSTFYTLNASVKYSLLTRSLGAVEEENGFRWQIASLNDEVNGTVYPRVYGMIENGVLLPLDHSSLWVRAAVGYSPGDRAEPFANFYFGGFGNNWVDRGEIRRFRQYYAFPGASLNSIGGTNFGKLLLEWVVPPLRFRRFGGGSAYCTWAQLALFSGGIITNIDDAGLSQRVVDAGAQVDFRLVFFSALESTLSFGWAAAVEKQERATDEFMVSLKILH